MDKEIIQNWIKEICMQIPFFFKDDKKIKDNLENFVVFENMEWYNIALIYYQKPEASFVLSKNRWDEILPHDKSFFIKRGQRGIKILIPYITENDILFFKAFTVWDISQAQKQPDVEYISNLKMTIEEVEFEMLENIKLIDIAEYSLKCSLHDQKVCSFINQRDKIQDYIIKCICYVLSLYLPSKKIENLKFDNEITDEELIILYAVLADIIKNLHITFKNYYVDLHSRILKKKEQEEAIRISDMNIKQRIMQATAKIETERRKIKEFD